MTTKITETWLQIARLNQTNDKYEYKKVVNYIYK